jgi:hypothetical protein
MANCFFFNPSGKADSQLENCQGRDVPGNRVKCSEVDKPIRTSIETKNVSFSNLALSLNLSLVCVDKIYDMNSLKRGHKSRQKLQHFRISSQGLHFPHEKNVCSRSNLLMQMHPNGGKVSTQTK